ncbi:hypothetical protein [Flavobacterium johnsoniae]|uniref:Uncharacterized protein n=1 Tax=Flavobacterium johnsoniae (strain ATCC 17061 / DSM 2064 / JCM 8514 / BCRC 14874 / CCUG 350202 / NBRC 14942 / NCIMB 11054 / UW101) TaxID=376686 RepID=A5FDH7_FLAJ1|nr:hypothetical protein [Flavobacterium johnsoniae]ABQ06742.1 hypothetical protein Fjoh_3728 [Flavobacterium johnsoniae UW101]OXE95232.1 hypothetical protein B0A63_24975 [Flavobacterium johnsoniae UW101]WQG82499.1 hypothetical protein SR927_05140 [Flavobacterium johnsoniae UW101]SHM03322.1 hypothetical protein SAMN05444146_5243 [Flavobacterium johnsoniae]
MDKFLKNIVLIFILSSNLLYSQKQKTTDMKAKNLSYKEGSALIVKYNFKEIDFDPNDKEHTFYINEDKQFLIYFKFIGDFTLYPSMEYYIKVMETSDDIYPIINFDNFQDKIEERISFLNNLLGTNISSLDKQRDVEAFDKAIKDFGIKKIDFNSLFMNFFSYYYVVLRNELNYQNIEIQSEDGRYDFFIFSNEKNKTEILSSFYRMIIDPDDVINFNLRVDIVTNPFIIPIGKSNLKTN